MLKYCIMEREKAEGILRKLKTGETKKINEGVKEIEGLWERHIDEKWERIKGTRATDTLRFLRDELIKMCNHDDWKMRYAGLRGLRRLAISDVFDERIEDMIKLFLESIMDDDGRVRRATVHTFGWMRPMGKGFTADMYAELYLKLQNMYHSVEDEKKKKSIDQVLGKLWCPLLDTIMAARGYVPEEDDYFSRAG